MKATYILPLAFLSASLFSACNGNNTTAQEENALEKETIAEEIREGNDVEQPKIPAAVDTTITLQTVGNSLEEMAYSTNEIRVPANGRIKVILENNAEDDSMIHNIVFLKKNQVEEVTNMAEQAGEENAYVPDLPAVFAGSELAEPGETVELLFTAPFQSGEYAFVCTYPEHWQEMNGKFIVEAVTGTE